MRASEDGATLLGRVIEQIKESKTLHFIGDVRTKFGNGVLGAHVGMGARLEAWYKSPRWRIELTSGRAQWVGVLTETCDYVHVFSHGRWTRGKATIPITVGPDEIKLRLLGLDSTNAVTYTAMEESVLHGEPVWVIHGVDDREQRFTWWVSKDELVVKKAERKNGYFEFEHAGERKRCQAPGESVLEFETVELGVGVPGELFEVPPDAPLVETIDDGLWGWLEKLVL